jgi:hypothetical protein
VAFISKSDLKELYKTSKDEAYLWRQDYPSYERLADNGLMEGLDPNLPEVNDGSLAAALFKLPKRIVSSKLTGTVKALDRDEAWMSELANLVWQNEIIPNANTQAPFHRKWKDAVRKAAIYGSVPLITIFVEKNGKRHADFIVGQPQDVTLEPGKVSDYDSDVIFWDVYYTKLQLENMIEDAKAEKKSSKDKDEDEYNKWDIEALEGILAGNKTEERNSKDSPRQEQDKNVRAKGFKFCIAFQRGISSPFYMYYSDTNKTVREWSNPDPTGDIPVHFLYCYQDFINPYGIGIVKLAGGTQNVLDYMRQADVLATQLGLRPPIAIEGDADSVDLESIVYAQDALWFTGNAKVVRQELANGVYSQLPGRMSMYQASLQKLIPTGDTSMSGTDSGDPTQSKTPAGVKLAAANLSIDDEDFKDNLYITYEAKAKSMINTQFANMEGTDLMKLNDDEREILIKGGMEFPKDANGEMSNQVELVWDTTRATFDFEVDPEQDKAKDDADKLEGLTRVAELSAADPNFAADLQAVGKKFNKGELYADMIALTSDNDKIITDVSPDEEQVGADGQPIAAAPQGDPMQAQAVQQADEKHQMDMQSKQQDMANKQQKHDMSMQKAAQPATTAQGSPTPDEMQANVDALMQQYGVDENMALAALAAEHEGLPTEDIIAKLQGA